LSLGREGCCCIYRTSCWYGSISWFI
jgi:hypothetical protein